MAVLSELLLAGLPEQAAKKMITAETISAENRTDLNDNFFIVVIIFYTAKMHPYAPGMVTLLSKVVVLLSKQGLHLLPESGGRKAGFFVKYAGEVGFFIVPQFIANFSNG